MSAQFNLAEDDSLQDSPNVRSSSAEFPIHGQSPVETAFNLAEDTPLQDSPYVELNPAKLTPARTLETPYAGMFFDTLKEAGDYYEDYGRQQGFWTRIRSSYKRKQHSDDVTGRLYVCVHEGKHEPNAPTETPIIDKEDVRNKGTRTGSTIKSRCPACFWTFDKYHLKWKVTGFNDNHNHKPVTPCKRMKMKCNRHMPNVIKDLTEAFRRENLQVSKLPSIFEGTNLGFDKRDCYNHLRDVRHRELEMGDAQGILNYFRKKQDENPHFYYSMQCDDNGRATNFFWVDARSRMSYKYFGDVITFDTTYRTNKYDMPFALFTGVNHHSQSIQFGCALLQDETVESFLWLFETWLRAMDGNPPVSIITDQDLAMKRAIALADEYGIKFFETSAKTNLNVEEVFFSVARDIKKRLLDSDTKAETTIKINLLDASDGGGQAAQKSTCCGS